MSLLPVEFFRRDALYVARDLLGKQLKLGDVRLRISEVEAYRWPDDSANHGCSGQTKRNQSMWGPPGNAYVYLCYGIHHLLNVVTQDEGIPSAVLIRACEPLEGLDTIQRRRHPISGTKLLDGPGKVGAALALDLSWDGHRLVEAGGLELHSGPDVEHILCGPRIGIDFAEKSHREAPWRLAIAGCSWVGHRRLLNKA